MADFFQYFGKTTHACYNDRMNRFLILNDMHFGTSRVSTTHENIVRQANTQAKETFEEQLPHFQSLPADTILQLGDTLRDTFDKATDTQNILDAISVVSKINKPAIHVLGNHELLALPRENISEIYKSVDVKPQFMGYQELEDIRIIWLDLELDEHKLAYFTQEHLDIISQIETSEKPLVAFSHYSLTPINPAGSFYFENSPEGMYYKNYEQALKLLKEKNLKLSVNAHVHLFTHQVVGNTHFISSPAFSENIAAHDQNNNPGVYSILEIDGSEFAFTSYSGKFCFAKTQGKL